MELYVGGHEHGSSRSGIPVDVDDQKVVMKEEVVDVVMRMMKTAEVEKMKDNALRLKESATKAVLPGGSSFLNLDTFVKDMVMWKGFQS